MTVHDVDEPDPVEEFAAHLRALREEAGDPSLDRLVELTSDTEWPLARSTIHDKLLGKTVIAWEAVRAFVTACAAHAESEGIALSQKSVDVSRWDSMHAQMLDRVAEGRTQARLAKAAREEIARRAARLDGADASSGGTSESRPAMANLPAGGGAGFRPVYLEQRSIQGDPVIATVERKPSNPRAPMTVTVDSDPPRETTVPGTIHSILLEARTTQAVTLRALRAVIVNRRDPRRACLGPPAAGGILKPRPFTADFDTDPPKLTALEADFPFTISATDVEQFDIEPRVSFHEVSWRLEIAWVWQGRRGTTIVDDGGKPFEIYPTPVLWDGRRRSVLNWGCDGFVDGHVPGCPASRLAALWRAGAVPTPETGAAKTELEAEFPDWAVWRSDGGRWYATQRGPGGRGAVAADSPNGLRIRLHTLYKNRGTTR